MNLFSIMIGKNRAGDFLLRVVSLLLKKLKKLIKKYGDSYELSDKPTIKHKDAIVLCSNSKSGHMPFENMIGEIDMPENFKPIYDEDVLYKGGIEMFSIKNKEKLQEYINSKDGNYNEKDND